MPQPKLFPIEKILTISASDYCASIGRNLRDYELKGITFEGRETLQGKNTLDGEFSSSSLMNNFRLRIPSGVETVVGFNFSYGGVGYAYGFSDSLVVSQGKYVDFRSMASGTALIRKKKKAK